MIKALGLFTAACVLFASPAQANYVFNPADLPEGFECHDGPEEPSCEGQKRHEAWYNIYGERYNFWVESLLFRTDIYFARRAGPLPILTNRDVPVEWHPAPSQTSNLVDARYDVQLRRFGDWAFAITKDARMRLVRYKRMEEAALLELEHISDALPISMEEVATHLSIAAVFEEADLKSCSGAIAHLLRFPGQEARPLWDTRELEFASDYAPKEIEDSRFITLDGAGVHVLTRGVKAHHETPVAQLSYSEFNGGAVYAWTLEMREITRPCLKPSEAMPPWHKFVDAAKRASEKRD